MYDLITPHNLLCKITFINAAISMQRFLDGRNPWIWYLNGIRAYQSLALKAQFLSQKKIVKVYLMGEW